MSMAETLLTTLVATSGIKRDDILAVFENIKRTCERVNIACDQIADIHAAMGIPTPPPLEDKSDVD
jgi:hypothetical protein